MANEVDLEIACKNVFQITSRRYRQLASDGMVPEVVKGKIDILNSAKALLDYYRKLSQGQGSLTLTDERVRLTRINADTKELELREKSGQVIDVEIAMRLWGALMQKIRTRLLYSPVKKSPLHFGLDSIRECKKICDECVREVLTELANIDLKRQRPGKKRAAGNKGSSVNTKSAAGSKRKPVGRKKTKVKPGSKRRTRKVV